MPQNHENTKRHKGVILRIFPKDLHSLMLADAYFRKVLAITMNNLE